MGKGDVGIDRCYSSPTMYHKPGAIHFTNTARTAFIRGCRYCNEVFSYLITHGDGPPIVTRQNHLCEKIGTNV